MALTPADVKSAFQNAIPRRRDEFAKARKHLLATIVHETLYQQLYPIRVLEMAEAELRERVALAADRVKQLINSGWLPPDEMTTVRTVFLDMFAGYDRWDKDPQSDLYHSVEKAFDEVGSAEMQQATINSRRLSEVQVQSATEALSDLEVYFGENHPAASAPAAQQSQDRAAVVRSAAERFKYDAFICHASEDKEFVGDLAEGLRKRGLRVWYDDYVLTPGDGVQAKIDEGLRSSRYGIVVLSQTFFTKVWPKRELGGLFAKQTGGSEKVVLPVLHGINPSQVAERSPLLADMYAANSADGIETVVEDLVGVLAPMASVEERPAVPIGVAQTFRSQIFEFVTEARSLLLRYGTNPSNDRLGELLIEYAETMAVRYEAIKHHLQSVLGFKAVESLVMGPLPMTRAAIAQTLDRLERIGVQVPADLPAYPVELDSMS